MEKSDMVNMPRPATLLARMGLMAPNGRHAAGKASGRHTNAYTKRSHSTLYSRTYLHAPPTLYLNRLLACTLKAGPKQKPAGSWLRRRGQCAFPETLAHAP